MILLAVPSCPFRTIVPLSRVGKSRVTAESTLPTTMVYTHPSDEEWQGKFEACPADYSSSDRFAAASASSNSPSV
jgi:hypothetical protein